MSRVTERPNASSEAALKRMRNQRQEDTSPELALRRAVWRLGLRYRVHVAPLGGRRKADIVFPVEKLAVYMDGCYWHGCPLHGTLPKSNRDWWVAKLEANRLRDRDTDRALMSAGWAVMRFWEHEDPTEAADQIARSVRRSRTP